MSAVTSALGRPFAWVRRHFVSMLSVVTASALALFVLLAASGLWLSPTAATPPPPSTTTTTTPAPHVSVDSSPAAVVVASVMSQLRIASGFTPSATSFATSDPLLAGCSTSIIPVAQIARSLTLTSASLDVVVNIDVYGAGLGARVLARTLRSTSACAGDYVQSSSPVGLNGFVASSIDVAGSSILQVTARLGDVVFSLYGFPTGYHSASSATMALATLVQNALTPEMAAVCPFENEGVIAAQRNPTQSDYHPYAVTTVVTPPSSVPRPNLALLYGALPVVATPPPGSITSAPTPPVVPTIALSTTIATAQFDPVGPGCGWAFTGMVPPVFTPSSQPISVLTADAIAQLESTWTNWPRTVATYLTAKATYLSELLSYQATTTTTTSTTTTTPNVTSTSIPSAPSTTTTIAAPTPHARR